MTQVFWDVTRHWTSCVPCFIKQPLLNFTFTFSPMHFCLALTIEAVIVWTVRKHSTNNGWSHAILSNTHVRNSISQKCFSMNFKQCHKLKEITALSKAKSITTCLPVQGKINRKEYNNSVLLGCDIVKSCTWIFKFQGNTAIFKMNRNFVKIHVQCAR